MVKRFGLISVVGVVCLFSVIQAGASEPTYLSKLDLGAPAAERTSESYPDTIFDGTGSPSIKYATVVSTSGSRLYLYKAPPADCSESTVKLGDQTSYLVPGDAVAFGQVCGEWVHVQYVGKSKVSVGWALAAGLKVSVTSADSGDEGADGSESSANGRNYEFELVKGRGTPVCQAYLQRLNQTRFVFPPSCGRPEFDGVPGFTRLKRQWLTTAEVNRVYNDVMNFNDNHLPISYERVANPDGTLTMTPWAGHFPPEVKFDIWRVQGGFDIENEGRPENVVMWANGGRGGGTCGLDAVHTASYYGVILSPGGYTVDRKRTIEVFEREHLPGLEGHFPIGASMGLFQYRDKTYFDTFLDQPLTTAELGQQERRAHALAVFSRQNHRTVRVCEYSSNN
jgi:hypothetical protein